MKTIKQLLEEFTEIEHGLETDMLTVYNEGEPDNTEDENVNNVVDLTNNFSKTPTIQEVKDYIQSLINKYHYFETIVKIGENQYKVILNTEQYKGESTIKPQTVHLYDVLEVK